MKPVAMFLFCLWGCQAFAQTTQTEVLTNTSIITMKKMKFSVGVIKNKISTTQCTFNTDIPALSELKNAGVDDEIIEIMVSKTSTTVPMNNLGNKGGGGILSADNLTYTTMSGKQYHVGDQVRVNVGSISETGEFKYISKDEGKVFNLVNHVTPLEKEYASQSYSIKKIYSVKSSKTDIFSKNVPHTVYLVFEPTKGIFYRIAIEAALQEKEVLPN